MPSNFRPALNKENWLADSDKIKIKVEVKPYSLTELAGIFKYSNKVMSMKLKKMQDVIGKKIGRYYSVNQVEKIFVNEGVPYVVEQTY